MTRFTLAAALCAVLAYLLAQQTGRALNRERAGWKRAEARVWVPTPRAARLLSVGYNEFAADVAWARTLVYYGDGIANQSSLTDVDALLALVNALDPQFRRPYLWGGYATVYRRGAATGEEFRASIVLLERGLTAFPNDWEMAWLLGLRYYLDLESADPAEQRRYKELGADWIERAMRMPGAPPDLPGLAASMRTQLGQKERALRELREMILNTSDEKARAHLIGRYAALASKGAAAELDRAKQEFDAAWLATLPYAPPVMYVLIGPPVGDQSLADLIEPPASLVADEPVAPEEPADPE